MAIFFCGIALPFEEFILRQVEKKYNSRNYNSLKLYVKDFINKYGEHSKKNLYRLFDKCNQIKDMTSLLPQIPLFDDYFQYYAGVEFILNHTIAIIGTSIKGNFDRNDIIYAEKILKNWNCDDHSKGMHPRGDHIPIYFYYLNDSQGRWITYNINKDKI